MSKLTHGSLFSGVGGGDIGFELAGFDNLFLVENDPFCREVLKIRKTRWSNAELFCDVHDVGKHNLPTVDVMSGGFPCTDISISGKKHGIGTPEKPTEHSGLWFEFIRVIRECRPPWVLIENVSNLKTTGADQVFFDLETANYAFWPTVVGAEIIGAPHQRNRVWVLCHDNTIGHRDFGERMGEGWKIPSDLQRALEEKGKEWDNWKYVVGPEIAVRGLIPTPELCEMFMGFPTGWTDLSLVETPWYQLSPLFSPVLSLNTND